jgi:hypothetical protein
MIPTYLIEEHHEAFLIWNYSKLTGKINQNNTLIHIDSHPDNEIPKFNFSIHSLKSIKDFYDFTYNELTISNFIYPSIYLGIINKVVYIFQPYGNHKKTGLNEQFVRSINNAGIILRSGIISEKMKNYNDPERRDFLVEKLTIEDNFSVDTTNVILDIDLDYFSCEENPYSKEGYKIEITRNQYESLMKDKYHKLKIMPNGGSKVKVIEKNGQCFVTFQDYPYYMESKIKVSNEEILKRIEKLTNVLKSKNIQPKLINICRSTISGFTPEDQSKFIENNLLESLSKLYSMNIIEINELEKTILN